MRKHFILEKNPKGKLIQFDDPYNIYHFPASQDVASFFNKGTFITAEVISKNELSHKILGKIKGNFVHPHEKGKSKASNTT